MEAEWEFEVAPDAPMIDGAWEGLVDLRREPGKAAALPEAVRLPVLARTLERLNGSESPVWTAKCDVWTPDEFDADELDAPHDSANDAQACYIDLLPRDERTWGAIDSAGDWCRQICVRLRAVPVRQCRADLIVRRAFLTPETAAFGVTAYLTGCGANAAEAARALADAVCALADAVCGREP